jgi:hypothetical protein
VAGRRNNLCTIKAGAPPTGLRPYERNRCVEHGELWHRECARPTGGVHGRTARGPAQRFEAAKRRPREEGKHGHGHYRGRDPQQS